MTTLKQHWQHFIAALKAAYRARLVKRLANTNYEIAEISTLILKAQLVYTASSDKGYARYHEAMAHAQQELAHLKRRQQALHNLLGLQP